MCKIQCVPVIHTVYHRVHTSLFVSVHCNEPLVCFEASGFCYTFDTRTILISCCCPVSWKFCSFEYVGLAHSQVSAIHRCSGCGVLRTIVAGLVILLTSPYHYTQGQLSNTDLAESKEWGLQVDFSVPPAGSSNNYREI